MFKKSNFQMPDNQFKRNIAYKLRIEDIQKGNPIMENERFSFLSLEDKKVVRVNIIGSVVDKFQSDGEKNYAFITIDDGSGQIQLRAFADEAEKLKKIDHGQTILVIGLLRFFNNDVYISPEIIKDQNPKYLIVRKIEVEKDKPQVIQTEKEDVSIREKVIELIKNSESEGGIEMEKLISNLEKSKEQVEAETQKLLEEGIIFEPLPGKVRWLG